LENYDGTADFLRGLEISEGELTKAIIGSIGEMDAHQLPDAKGYSSMVRYLTGYSDGARQEYREQILGTSREDFKAFADVLDEVKENGQVVVLGSAEAIKEANQEREGFLDVKQVL
jgi:Zn-dependent M16 (insulinase) family peptidase